MNKYQKVLKEAAHLCGCGRIGCLIYRFQTFFFLHRLRLKKQTNQRRCITSKKKNTWLWSDFARRTTLIFSLPPSLVPPLLVTPKVSSLHKKQESLWLCYHYSYKNMTTTGSDPAYFFVILWHHERQGGGGCLGGSGGTKTCHPLCLTGPENSWFWGRFIIYIYIFFCVCVCLSEGISSSEHLHCQVGSGKNRGGVYWARGPRETVGAMATPHL